MKLFVIAVLLVAGATIFSAKAAAAPTLPPSVVSCEPVSPYYSTPQPVEMKAEDGTAASQNVRPGTSAAEGCDVVVQLAIRLQIPHVRPTPTVVLLGSKFRTLLGPSTTVAFGPDTCTTSQDLGLPSPGPAQLTDLTPLEIGAWFGLYWQKQESQTPLTLHYHKFGAELIVVAMLQNECVMHARKLDHAQLWADVNRIREAR